MSDMPELSGPSLPPAAGGAATGLVILLHGVGADGEDLIGLAPSWAEGLPHAAFASPHAPYPFDMGPFGYQWFSLRDVDPKLLLEGVRGAAPILDAFIDAELARWGVDPGRLALAGFSQGAMMALHVGLRRRTRPAAIVSYSGALVGPETLFGEMMSQPPVLLVHGDADPVVPVAALPAAEGLLKAHGVRVEAHVRPGLGHGIDAEGAALGARFLALALGG